MLKEIKTPLHYYFETEQNRIHGEYKSWHYSNGKPYVFCFFTNGISHGEYRRWNENGELKQHCFFVNGNYTSFEEIPYPNTPEDRLYVELKYNLPLLSDTAARLVL